MTTQSQRCRISQILETLVAQSCMTACSCIALAVNTKLGNVQLLDNGNGYILPQHDSQIKKRGSVNLSHILRNISEYCTRLDIVSCCKETEETLSTTVYPGQKWEVKKSRTPRGCAGTTVTIVGLSAVSSNLDSMNIIMRAVNYLALTYCRQTSITLKDVVSEQVLISSDRTRNLQEAIMRLHDINCNRKLRHVSGTQDHIQLDGVASCLTYTEKKTTLVTLNKHRLERCKIHSMVEKLLEDSLIDTHSISITSIGRKTCDVRGKHYLYVLNIAVDTKLYSKLMSCDPADPDSLWDDIIISLQIILRGFLYSNNLHQGAMSLRRVDDLFSAPLDHTANNRHSNPTNDSVLLCESHEDLTCHSKSRGRGKDNKGSRRQWKSPIPDRPRIRRKNYNATHRSHHSVTAPAGTRSKHHKENRHQPTSPPSIDKLQLISPQCSSIEQTANWIRSHFITDGASVYQYTNEQTNFENPSRKQSPFLLVRNTQLGVSYSHEYVWNSSTSVETENTREVALSTATKVCFTDNLCDTIVDQQVCMPCQENESSDTITTMVPFTRNHRAQSFVTPLCASNTIGNSLYGYYSAPALQCSLGHRHNHLNFTSKAERNHLKLSQKKRHSDRLPYIIPVRNRRVAEMGGEQNSDLLYQSMSPVMKQIFTSSTR